MAVGPDDNIRAIFRCVGTGDTLYANTFYLKRVGGASVPDSQVLDDVEDWFGFMYSALAGILDNEIDLSDCQVDLVEVEGIYNPDPDLNEAKVKVVRPLGYITPPFSPGNTNEEYDGIVTATITPKCFTPGPRPRKSISGLTEGVWVQKVISNAGLAALATFGLRWMTGPSFDYFVGTMSLVSAIFEAFDGSFTVKNTGGTMVTRKIGRGS